MYIIALRRRKSDMKKLKLILLSSVVILVLVVFALLLGKQLKDNHKNTNGDKTTSVTTADKDSEDKYITDAFLLSDSIKQDLLPINDYSRPGDKVGKITAIVIHYVGNPGTTAAQNRSYFNNLATLQNAYASSHYVVGLEGEIIQCVPLDEIAYASNNRNYDTISIECCHPDSGGKYNPATYESVVKLAAALCRTYNLNPETGVIRHYDVTGKICPKYYVENEEEWYAMKLAIKNAM